MPMNHPRSGNEASDVGISSENCVFAVSVEDPDHVMEQSESELFLSAWIELEIERDLCEKRDLPSDPRAALLEAFVLAVLEGNPSGLDRDQTREPPSEQKLF
jgi:hypothetical protein